MGTILNDLYVIRLLKGIVKGRSKDSRCKFIGNFVPDTHNL